VFAFAGCRDVNFVTNLVRANRYRTNMGCLCCTWLAQRRDLRSVEAPVLQIKSMRFRRAIGLGMRRAMQH
jgi:hypothetical protein